MGGGLKRLFLSCNFCNWYTKGQVNTCDFAKHVDRGRKSREDGEIKRSCFRPGRIAYVSSGALGSWELQFSTTRPLKSLPACFGCARLGGLASTLQEILAL